MLEREDLQLLSSVRKPLETFFWSWMGCSGRAAAVAEPSASAHEELELERARLSGAMAQAAAAAPAGGGFNPWIVVHAVPPGGSKCAEASPSVMLVRPASRKR